MSHRSASTWLVTNIVLPLAPFGLAALFRHVSAQKFDQSLWWCSEIPFFALVMAAGVFLRCSEILSNPATGEPSPLYPWGRLLSGLIAAASFVPLICFYIDTTISKLTDHAREFFIRMEIGLSVLALAFGVILYLLDKRIDVKKLDLNNGVGGQQ